MPYADRLGDRTSYDTFGRVWTSATPSAESRFAFTGRDVDPESDLYHYRARYYDPATGQFIITDPIGFEAGDGNLYRYVGSGPLDAMDPTGLDEQWYFVDPMGSMAYGYSLYRGRTITPRKSIGREVFISRYGLKLNRNEQSVSKRGCVGILSVIVMAQPSTGEEIYSANQGLILQDRARYFTTCEAARDHYNSLREDGESPALFGFMGAARPLTAEEYQQVRWYRKSVAVEHIAEAFQELPDIPLPEALLPFEISWGSVNPAKAAFDYIVLVNIDTGFGKTAQWIDANHAEPGMDVFVDPVDTWKDGRNVVWGVVIRPANRKKDFDLAFDIPRTPWKKRPREWSVQDYDYSAGARPPFRTR